MVFLKPSALISSKSNEIHRPDVVLAHGNENIVIPYQTYIATSVLAYTLFCCNMGFMMVTSQSIFIARAFGGPRMAVWYANSFAITMSSTVPLIYAISDIIGRRIPMLTATIVSFIGVIISSQANKPSQLLVGLITMGLGSAGLAVCMIAAGDIVPVRKRPAFLALIELGISIPSIITPIIGGALADHNRNGDQNGWRLAFYAVLGFYIIDFPLLYFYFQPVKQRPTDWKSRLLTLDFLGAALAALAVTLILVGLSMSTEHLWTSAHVLGPLVTGCSFAIIFILWCYCKSNPIFPQSLFTFWNYPLLLLTSFINGFFLIGFVGFIPGFLVHVFKISALRVGILQLPNTVTMAACSFTINILITLTRGMFRPFLSAGFAFGVLAAGFLTLVKPGSDQAMYLGFGIVLGMASGITSAVTLALTQLSVLQRDLGIGQAWTITCRSLGGSVSIQIFNTIKSNRMRAVMKTKIRQAVLPLGFPEQNIPQLMSALFNGTQPALARVPNITQAVIQLGLKATSDSTNAGYNAAFYAVIAFATLGSGVVWLMHPIKKERMTNVVAVEIKSKLLTSTPSHNSEFQEEKSSKEHNPFTTEFL